MEKKRVSEREMRERERVQFSPCCGVIYVMMVAVQFMIRNLFAWKICKIFNDRSVMCWHVLIDGSCTILSCGKGLCLALNEYLINAEGDWNFFIKSLWTWKSTTRFSVSFQDPFSALKYMQSCFHENWIIQFSVFSLLNVQLLWKFLLL